MLESLFLNYKKYIINLLHIVVAVFLSIVIIKEFIIDNSTVFSLVSLILMVAVFYIHSLLFMPLLFNSKKINRYVILTFSLFALSAVLFVILHISNRHDYIYVFTKILNHGLAYGNNIEKLYGNMFFFAIFLFIISFVYGFITTKTSNKHKVIFKELFCNPKTELYLNMILIVLISGSLYFVNNSFSDIMLWGLLMFYIHTFVIAPLLLKRNMYKIFVLSIVVEIIIFGTYINYAYTQYQIVSVYSIGFSFITIASIYAVIRYRYKEQRDLFLKKDTELKYLKSQINPHFMFNSLNSLYGFALKENATKTAESIKKMSNLIRFMLTDMDKDFIDLKSEIQYLRDYIDIQLTRCSVKQNIEVNVSGVGEQKIAPMMLIPFVENAFKHGIDRGSESELKISVVCNNNEINFTCYNTKRGYINSEIKEEGFGIGIANIKSRLNIIYTGKHSINIEDTETNFCVRMIIKIE